MYTLVGVVSKQGCIYVANEYPTSAINMPIGTGVGTVVGTGARRGRMGQGVACNFGLEELMVRTKIGLPHECAE